MTTVGVSQAKATFSQLIDVVNAGEEVTITRHGEAVARLVPARSGARVERRALIREIKKLRKSLRMPHVNLPELIEEGRD